MIQIELVSDCHMDVIVMLIWSITNRFKREDVMLIKRPIAKVSEDGLLNLNFSQLQLVPNVCSNLTVHWNPSQNWLLDNPVFAVSKVIETLLIVDDHDELTPDPERYLFLCVACRPLLRITRFKVDLKPHSFVGIVVALYRDMVVRALQLFLVERDVLFWNGIDRPECWIVPFNS